MALGNVINALAEGSKKHIPYRDSKYVPVLGFHLIFLDLIFRSFLSLSCLIIFAFISPKEFISHGCILVIHIIYQ